MTTTPERLREAMADRRIDQSALAAAIGVTQGSISLILLGKTRRSKHLPDIARHLGVSLPWLMGYDDPKHPEGPEEVLLNPRERELLSRYRLLGPIHSMTVRKVVEGSLLRQAVDDGAVAVVTEEQPGEAALTRMFEALLAASPRLSGVELARELAKRLPKALSRLRGPLLELDVGQPDSPPAPAEAPTSDRREPRRVRRT